MSKYKATGCARFFVVMLILAPLAYIGASYYNGQDPIQNIKVLLGLESEEGEQREVKQLPPPTPEASGDETTGETESDGADNNSGQSAPISEDDATKSESSENAGDLELLKSKNDKLSKENEWLKQKVKALEAEINMLKGDG